MINKILAIVLLGCGVALSGASQGSSVEQAKQAAANAQMAGVAKSAAASAAASSSGSGSSENEQPSLTNPVGAGTIIIGRKEGKVFAPDATVIDTKGKPVDANHLGQLYDAMICFYGVENVFLDVRTDAYVQSNKLSLFSPSAWLDILVSNASTFIDDPRLKDFENQRAVSKGRVDWERVKKANVSAASSSSSSSSTGSVSSSQTSQQQSSAAAAAAAAVAKK